ncbi:MAG: YicC/YloC family endoribonuclease [Fibrobacterota bacterium]
MPKSLPIYSMTGFGRGTSSSKKRKVKAEIKAVNNRYFECQLRGLRLTPSLEAAVMQVVNGSIERGTLVVHLNAPEQMSSIAPRLNMDLALVYKKIFEKAARALKYKEQPTLAELLQMPGVLQSNDSEPDAEFEQDVLSAVRNAVTSLNEMRACEGAHLADDLADRNRCIQQEIAKIEKQAPERAEASREKLTRKFGELVAAADESLRSRLFLETSLLAERTDITEELTRLKSHCDQLQETLHTGGGVGKKLNFLVQEINREANTISSKAGHSGIIQCCLVLKEETERMREQIQNLE